MFRKIFFLLMVTLAAVAFAQTTQIVPDKKELITRARSFYVESDSIFFKRAHLERSLMKTREFKAWGMQITADPTRADLCVRVRRIPFNARHFEYTVIDLETETAVITGEVSSPFLDVYGLIADEIAHKMRVYRGDPLAQPAP